MRMVAVASRRGGGRPRRCAFTLIELLVVVAVIALLVSFLLPALGLARETTKAAVCGSNQRQLSIAATAYTADNQDWMNPLEDWRSGDSALVEVTFRVLLFQYVGQMPRIFDCPSERVFVYADGFSASDESRTLAAGGALTNDRESWDRLYGIIHPLERWNFGGLGIAGVHWFRKNPPDLDTRPRVMPFGRTIEAGYREGLRKFAEIRAPGKLIWFGDGASNAATATWGDDNGWWIKSQAPGYAQGEPGFNRRQQNDYGCDRHRDQANYAFADGHVAKLRAADIHCQIYDCWWSIRPDVHRPTTD
jgi:prepilin-type processing-associated H-X9-DG protein/prepilin-type N-terminal cleavage/methylation domain-containing protein